MKSQYLVAIFALLFTFIANKSLYKTNWTNLIYKNLQFFSKKTRVPIRRKIKTKYSFYYIKISLFFFLIFSISLVRGQAPTITNLSSNICAGGSITITGSNLLTATSVTIGGTAVSSITSNTSTQIIAVVNTACTGNVKVTTSGGTATSAGTFTSNAIPAAPTVTTPINYCLNATASQLAATGSILYGEVALFQVLQEGQRC